MCPRQTVENEGKAEKGGNVIICILRTELEEPVDLNQRMNRLTSAFNMLPLLKQHQLKLQLPARPGKACMPFTESIFEITFFKSDLI